MIASQDDGSDQMRTTPRCAAEPPPHEDAPVALDIDPLVILARLPRQRWNPALNSKLFCGKRQSTLPRLRKEVMVDFDTTHQW